MIGILPSRYGSIRSLTGSEANKPLPSAWKTRAAPAESGRPSGWYPGPSDTMKNTFLLLALTSRLLLGAAFASEVFIEAESFTSSGGWSAIDSGSAARAASGVAVLDGAHGAKD